MQISPLCNLCLHEGRVTCYPPLVIHVIISKLHIIVLPKRNPSTKIIGVPLTPCSKPCQSVFMSYISFDIFKNIPRKDHLPPNFKNRLSTSKPSQWNFFGIFGDENFGITVALALFIGKKIWTMFTPGTVASWPYEYPILLVQLIQAGNDRKILPTVLCPTNS